MPSALVAGGEGLSASNRSPDDTGSSPGDVRRMWADPSAARHDLEFSCEVGFEEGLRRDVEWFERALECAIYSPAACSRCRRRRSAQISSICASSEARSPELSMT
jgi:hypothetical protein